jgi:hypothetical protein
VYARVSNQIDWIKTNVCQYSAFPPADLCGADGTSSPTKKSTPMPTPSPVSKQPTPSSDVCYPEAQKIKIEATTGRPIHVFEVNVMSEGINVAKGKGASQSSTLRSLVAERAIDGKSWTFSHTADSNAWLEIDLEDSYPITSVDIANRWCKDDSDPKNCLCRLSNANLSLIDGNGNVIATESLGNTCGKADVSVDYDPISCSPPTPAPQSSSGCNNSASKVKVQSTTGKPLHLFELEVYSSGVNVAKRKTATQSSTLKHLEASRAVDGKFKTFSHTAWNDSNAWISVDLGSTQPIETIELSNRYCGRNPSDPKGCLCRLSNAEVSLYDDNDNLIQSKTLGDTCDVLYVGVDFNDGCSSGETDIPTFSPTSFPTWW